MRYIIAALSLFAGVSLWAATPQYALRCMVTNDHADLIYQAGEEAVFTITVVDTNGVKPTAGCVNAVLDNFGSVHFLKKTFDLAKENPFTVRGRLAEAGFLRLTVTGKDVSPLTWSVAFDPTHIRPGAQKPDDFLFYWNNEKKRLANEVPVDAKAILLEDRSADQWEVYALSFATFNDKRVYGFMSVPKDKTNAPFPVHFNVPGAGPGVTDTGRRHDCVSVSLNVHPYDPLAGDIKKLYEAQNKELSAQWDVPGYATSGVSAKKEEYFFHDVILGIDRALDWVAARPYVDKKRIRYFGSSQGGGFGIILAGFNGNISRAVIFVPAITDLLGKNVGRQSGWPMITECQRSPEAKANAEKLAPYYDAVSFASYITCPIRFVVGFADTCCAPTAVYSAYNALPASDKEIIHGIGMGHSINRQFYEQLDKWLNAPDAKPLEKPAAPPSRQPLKLEPNKLLKFPLGAIRPEGWLRHQLDLQKNGLVGTLYEHSDFLAPDNGWLNPKVDRWKFPRKDGWEEQSYWFRTFVKLAVLTQEPRLLEVTRTWIEKIVAGADADGWFGAHNKKGAWWHGQYMTDIWGHMPMCEALWSWYEYTADSRITTLLVNFFKFCDSLEEGRLIPHIFPERGDWRYTIQYPRACDMNPVLYACYERTGEKVCLDLAAKLFARRRKPKSYVDRHTVNFAQIFPYATIFSRQSGNASHRLAADFWYDLHMSMWGQMPRGAFAADENIREGNVDPRYGTESCTWGELARSFQFLGRLTGETKWADRTEDVLFNHYPVSYTPDWKKLHYLTAPNQVMLDAGWDHDYGNYPPQIAYSDTMFRCCRHNAGLAFPLFTEHLAFTDAAGSLVFWMYAPSRGDTVLKGGRTKWRIETKYPFRERIDLTIEPPEGKGVAVRFRVPGWARGLEILKENKVIAKANAGDRWVELANAGKGVYEIRLTAEAEYRFWPRNGAVTVDRGPLSYSLAIGATTREVPRPVSFKTGSALWPESVEAIEKAEKLTEYLPTTPWNYGLDVATQPVYRENGWSDDCFVAANAPCEISVKGRRLPEWTLQDNQPAPLQESPAHTGEPLETLRFIPLGCARLRLSVLPTVTDGSEGVKWTRSAASVPRAQRAKIVDF
jgi:cephalosporin-C deacetylase-like acetyl esterase/DUF1680 family protein